jgi:hypothetical protein
LFLLLFLSLLLSSSSLLLFQIFIISPLVLGSETTIKQALVELADHSLVAAVCKKYLNDLPEPLFTFAMFNELIALGNEAIDAAAEGDNNKNNNKNNNEIENNNNYNNNASTTIVNTNKLATLVQQLPPTHISCLKILVDFIRELVSNEFDVIDARERVCLAFASAVIRPKVCVVVLFLLFLLFCLLFCGLLFCCFVVCCCFLCVMQICGCFCKLCAFHYCDVF